MADLVYKVMLFGIVHDISPRNIYFNFNKINRDIYPHYQRKTYMILIL